VFNFKTHPATIDVGGGMSTAFEYFMATWRKWLPAVGVAALATFFIYLATGQASSGVDYSTTTYGSTRTSTANINTFLVTPVTMIVGWVFTAIAISGLRNRPLTASWVVGRGIMAFLAQLLIGIVVVAAVFAIVVVILIAAVAGAALGVLVGLILVTAAAVLGVYLLIRIIFVSLAVFDGLDPIEGIKESWRLSNGSVLRMFGWGCMGALVSIGFGVLALIVSIPFTVASPAVGSGVSSLITLSGSCLISFFLAVLYESERARKYPQIYGAPAFAYPGYPGYPGAGYPPAGYPPAGYPGAMPGYPGAGPAYPGAPEYPGAMPGYPGAGPAYPGAGPAYPGAPGYPVPFGPGSVPGSMPGYPSQAPMPGWGAPSAPQPGWPPQAGGGMPPYPGSIPGYPASQPTSWQPPAYPAAPAWPATPASPGDAPAPSDSPAPGDAPTDPPAAS
jgi:hypothetical protein